MVPRTEIPNSPAWDERRRTARIYVALCGKYPEPLLLTAAHVAGPRGLPENLRVPFFGGVTAPGGLDNPRVFISQDLGIYWVRFNIYYMHQRGGETVQGRIGVDKSGFREDWAAANADQEEGPEWSVVGSWRAEIAC